MRGRPLQRSVRVARRDSSPVISWPLIVRIMNRFWIEATEHHHRAKATVRELLDGLREFFEVVDEKS